MPLHVLAEVRADRHGLSVDARLDFPEKNALAGVLPSRVVTDQRHRAARLRAQPGPAPCIAAPTRYAWSRSTREKSAAAPQPVRPLKGEKTRAPSFGGDLRALRGDGVGRLASDVTHHLPTDSGIGIK